MKRETRTYTAAGCWWWCCGGGGSPRPRGVVCLLLRRAIALVTGLPAALLFAAALKVSRSKGEIPRMMLEQWQIG